MVEGLVREAGAVFLAWKNGEVDPLGSDGWRVPNTSVSASANYDPATGGAALTLPAVVDLSGTVYLDVEIALTQPQSLTGGVATFGAGSLRGGWRSQPGVTLVEGIGEHVAVAAFAAAADRLELTVQLPTELFVRAGDEVLSDVSVRTVRVLSFRP